MRIPEWIRSSGGRSASAQVAGVVLVWLFVVLLHPNNDGLWYQGDAPRHAANGLFWWDFLTSFPANPFEFALSYYARYPVISPLQYPPVFYLVESVAFFVFGPSPLVAKTLVLSFALAAGLYMTAWLRRWIAAESGWAGALLILQSGVISWSHAVMLNIPSMAMGLATLYHARRWLDAPASRHVYPTVILGVLGILTYVHTGLVVFIVVAWIVAERRWSVLADRRLWVLCGLGALVISPWAVVAFKWAPVAVASAIGGTRSRWAALWPWTFYLKAIAELFTAPALALAVVGLVAGLSDRRWRGEVRLAAIWGVICYFGLSYLIAKDTRYILLAAPPIIILCVVGLLWLAHGVAAWLPAGFHGPRVLVGDFNRPSRVFEIGLAILLVLHLVRAPSVRVPFVSGFEDVVGFFEREGPTERIFYDGRYNGIFSFYVRARDPGFTRGVVLGSRLLYSSAIMWHLTERVSSASEVVDLLRRECGCRWVAVETSEHSGRVAAAQYLRQAVEGAEFQIVRSFRLESSWPIQVDVYRFLPAVERRDDVELLLPGLGDGTVLRAKPLER